MNSANGFVLFPCRTMRAACRIAPLNLPIILKFMSPPLCCPQWDVAPSTWLRSWKNVFNKSDNTLSQNFPVRHDVKERMPTSLVNSVTTEHKLIKGNRSHIEGGMEISSILLTVVAHCWKDQYILYIYIYIYTVYIYTYTYIHIWSLTLIVFSEKSVSCSVLFTS